MEKNRYSISQSHIFCSRQLTGTSSSFTLKCLHLEHNILCLTFFSTMSDTMSIHHFCVCDGISFQFLTVLFDDSLSFEVDTLAVVNIVFYYDLLLQIFCGSFIYVVGQRLSPCYPMVLCLPPNIFASSSADVCCRLGRT